MSTDGEDMFGDDGYGTWDHRRLYGDYQELRKRLKSVFTPPLLPWVEHRKQSPIYWTAHLGRHGYKVYFRAGGPWIAFAEVADNDETFEASAPTSEEARRKAQAHFDTCYKALLVAPRDPALVTWVDMETVTIPPVKDADRLLSAWLHEYRISPAEQEVFRQVAPCDGMFSRVRFMRLLAVVHSRMIQDMQKRKVRRCVVTHCPCHRRKKR